MTRPPQPSLEAAEMSKSCASRRLRLLGVALFAAGVLACNRTASSVETPPLSSAQYPTALAAERAPPASAEPPTQAPAPIAVPPAAIVPASVDSTVEAASPTARRDPASDDRFDRPSRCIGLHSVSADGGQPASVQAHGRSGCLTRPGGRQRNQSVFLRPGWRLA